MRGNIPKDNLECMINCINNSLNYKCCTYHKNCKFYNSINTNYINYLNHYKIRVDTVESTSFNKDINFFNSLNTKLINFNKKDNRDCKASILWSLKIYRLSMWYIKLIVGNKLNITTNMNNIQINLNIGLIYNSCIYYSLLIILIFK